MDISTRTKKTLLNEDQRWIGNGGEPIGRPRPIVLDRSLLDLATAYPNGFIPSGIPLGRVAATGLYGPYTGSTEEVQTITVSATGGTFTITLSGQATAAIAWNAAASAVQAALVALPNVNAGDIVVTGGPGGTAPYTLTFGGQYANTDVPAVTTDASSLTGGAGTAAVATATPGGADTTSDGRQVCVGHLFASIPYDRDSTGDLGAALFWSGEVVTNHLPPAPAHQIDANGRADCSHIAYVTHTV
jgi:hypothetical protein